MRRALADQRALSGPTAQRQEFKALRSPFPPGLENEGGGTRTAAWHYNEMTREFVASGRIAEAAREAKKASEGPKGEGLRRAEEEG